MTALSPHLAAIVLAIGLVLSLGCYLVSNLSPGGMITPGWIALGLVQNPRLGLVVLGVVLATATTARLVGRVVILYGKRLFAAVLAQGVFFSTTAFLGFAEHMPALGDTGTVGLIVPGLVAYQLLRQPLVPTLVATSAVTALTYAIVLTGVAFGAVPTDGTATELAHLHVPSLASGATKLALLGLVAAVAAAMVAHRLRRIEWTLSRGFQPAFAFAGGGGSVRSEMERTSRRVESDAAKLARLVAELAGEDRRRFLLCLRDHSPESLVELLTHARAHSSDGR
jgi:poly-gamma-glutamate biosynthesis protein PgsC/CapC